MKLVLAILILLTFVPRADLGFPPTNVSITQLNDRRDAVIQWTQNSKATQVTIFAHRTTFENETEASGFSYFVTLVRTGVPGPYKYVEEQSMLPYYDQYYFYEYFDDAEVPNAYGPYIASKYLPFKAYLPIM